MHVFVIVRLRQTSQDERHALVEMEEEYTLIDACREGNLSKAKEFLSQGCSPNKTDFWRRTPLIISAKNGHENVVSHLIAIGAKIDEKDHYNQTALKYASVRGHLKVVKALLTAGAKIDEVATGHSTPLMLAAYGGHHNVVSCLVASGADVDKKGYCGQTALHHSSERGHLKIVKTLLNTGAKIDEVDQDHYTPLMLAAREGHDSVVSHLITSGANVNKKGHHGRTPLHVVSMKGHLKAVEILLNLGAKIDVLDANRSTPLNLAASEGHHNVVCHLVVRGANVDKKDIYNRTPLHKASKRGHLNAVEALLEACAKIDEQDKHCATPLMLAACKGHDSVVSHLITSGANVNKKGHDNRTPLHVAIMRGQLKVVKALLNAGAKIDEVDRDHFTPLMLAVHKGLTDVVSYLLDHGADVAKYDYSGDTALHVAAQQGRLEIVKILLNKGAEVDQENKDHYSPLVLSVLKKNHEVTLHLIASGADVAQLERGTYFGRDLGIETLSYAIIHKHIEVAKILITEGVAVEGLLSTSPPMTALMWTAQEGDDSLTKDLILQGVNVNYQDLVGHTALHVGAQHNHIQCGVLLVEAGADVSVVNEASQTPLDLSSNEFKDAILHTLSFQTKKTVCVIGNAMSGKSTLIASLQNENASFLKKICNWLFGVWDISERTAGIEPVSLRSKRYGDVMFFDFAGQHEYHGPHEIFLESILTEGLSTVTIIVVVKATEEESAICHQLNRWLHPFMKMSSSTNPVRVIVIGSYMDKVKYEMEAKEKLELCYRRVKDSLREVPLKFEDLCYLDCRQPYASDIYKLCTYLSDVPPPQYKARDAGYSICWVISRIRSFFEDKVISVSEFSDWIAHNKANLPTNLPLAGEVCKDLSSTGHFLYLPSKEGTFNGWLVLDLPSILHEVYGTLFSPSKKIVNKFGLLNCQRLSVLFPTLDPSMIRDVLISLEFCVEVDPSILSESTHLMDGSDEGHKHLFFPALVATSPPKIFKNCEGSHILSWQLKVSENSFLSPRLLQAIILQLAAHHVFHHKRGSETREHYCSVWSNGIFWQSLSVDVGVEISNSAVVQVIGRSEVSSEELCTYVSTIIEDIFSTICNLSPRLSGGTYMIHPVNPQALLENPRSPSPQEMFPVEFILESRRNDKKGCLSCKGKEERAVRKLISDVFGGFEPSVHVIKGFQMPSCECTLCVWGVCVCVDVCSCVCTFPTCMFACVYLSVRAYIII